MSPAQREKLLKKKKHNFRFFLLNIQHCRVIYLTLKKSPIGLERSIDPFIYPTVPKHNSQPDTPFIHGLVNLGTGTHLIFTIAVVLYKHGFG